MEHLNLIIIQDVYKIVHLINIRILQDIVIGVINHVVHVLDLHNINVNYVKKDLIYIEIHVIIIHVQVQHIWLIMIQEYANNANGVVKYVPHHLIVQYVQVDFIYIKDGVI
jgi:hypothetical protein